VPRLVHCQNLGFQALSDDETQTPEQRAEDARKAAFWRWLAQRAALKERASLLSHNPA
jgi:hypothetical protein